MSVTVTTNGPARIAGVLALLCSSVLTLIVVASTVFALYSVRQDRDGGYCESIDHPAKCDSEIVIGSAGFGLAGLGLWGGAAGAGLLLGRPWARRAAMFVFAVWAVLVTALFVATAVDNDGLPLRGVVGWFVIAGLFVTIAVVAQGLPREP